MFSIMSVCLSMCLSVQAITFEPLHHIWVKIKCQGQGHVQNNDNLLISTCYSFVCGYSLPIRSRSHIKRQGQINAKVESRSLLRRGTLMRVVCI